MFPPGPFHRQWCERSPQPRTASLPRALPSSSATLRRASRESPASNCSSVIPGFNPSATCAPGLAPRTYQHSVLPQGSPIFGRLLVIGCTCTDNFLPEKEISPAAETGLRNRAACRRALGRTACNFAQLVPGERPIGHAIVFPRQPAFADRFLHNLGVNGRRSRTPQGRSSKIGISRNG